MELIAELKYFYDKVIGIDLGNGLVKIRSVYADGRPYKLTVPNAFVRKSELGKGEALGSLRLDYYTIEGQTYGWGKEIMHLPTVLSSAGHTARYATLTYKIMAKIALAKVYHDLGIGANDKVLIVTGVPSDETDTPAEAQIKDAFKGIHKVIYNGNNMLFEVDNVTTMSQPVATVMSRFLTEHGTEGNVEYLNMKVAVIDIGGGTTDLDIVHNMRRLNNHKTIKSGFNDIYDKIRADIRKIHHTANPTDFELLRIILQGEDEEGRLLYRPSKRLGAVDISDALDSGVYDLVVDIHGEVSRHWKDQYDIDELLLVGGSADLFEEYIGAVAKGVVIPENNGDSNVEGYFRTGMLQSLQEAQEAHKNLLI